MKLLFYICMLLGIPTIIDAQSIITTKHNLSSGGPGTVKASSEDEICIFCHTAHNTNPLKPLWNRNDPGANYTIYTSSTLRATPGQPSGSSILCLSCHDGTIALGEVLSRGTLISFASTVYMPVGPSNLTTNLQNDHPISFAYDVALATANPELKSPLTLPSTIKLENNQLQCTSCHDPHIDKYTKFLVATSQNSALCITCHQENNWTTSSHNTSTKTWNAVAPNPWPYTPWTTVAQNACENCHNPHNAGSTYRLLKYQTEEDNCLDCHNGDAASKNVKADFAKAYKHNVYAYTGIHDPYDAIHNPTEGAIPNTKHVECVDCHNPHSTKSQAATAPAVKGSNNGVVGINQSGAVVNPVTNEYEICYRCHSQNAVTGQTSPRVIVQNDQRLEFDPSNPSYHPVVAIGKNTTISGLISPLTASSMIYCTDCHASDGSGSPAGPHGSIYPQILKYNYDRSSTYNSSATGYDLCYQCHAPITTIANHNLLDHGSHEPHGNSTS